VLGMNLLFVSLYRELESSLEVSDVLCDAVGRISTSEVSPTHSAVLRELGVVEVLSHFCVLCLYYSVYSRLYLSKPPC
jgi:hypothetical protein